MSLEGSNFGASHFCCIKIHAETAEKLQVKYRGLILTGAPVVYDAAFHILSLNMRYKSYKMVNNKSKTSFITQQKYITHEN